ncbi:uncharacterized protein TNCV_1231171 [Trichonephila clavipes]|nr:uncharacterized protein TNCV_1231171 [Trichonephila clavipes]
MCEIQRAEITLVKLVQQMEFNSEIKDLSCKGMVNPQTPNHRGLWEAGVKAVKYHLRRVMGNLRFTYEEFLTILNQIEGVLNSRPLYPLSCDPGDFDALTPGHFLVGRPITAIAEPSLTEVSDNRLKVWQKQTKIVQHIWKRWSNNYLSTLQNRNKWYFEKNNVKIHDMHRKVTFANPLVEQRLFRSDDNLADRILKASALSNINDSENGNSSQVVDKVTKTDANTCPSTKLIPSADDIPSSLEYQSSDENLTDYCNFSISPLLVNCEESVCSILKDLTTPTWAHGLATLLFSKNIKTIGDLCKLNVHELRALPIKSPKVACLHNALIGHLKRTQDAISEKLNLDDWSLSTDSPENKINGIEADISLEGKIECEILEGVAQELLCDDRIQKLSTESLVALSKKSFLEVTKRLEDV